jgi:hypothetical protein
MTTIPFLKNSKNLQRTNVIFSADRKTLIHCPKNYSGEFEIPEGTETLGIEAFAGSKELTSIIFPLSLKKIEMLAFANSNALRKISIAGYGKITVADDAFDSTHFENCVLEVPAGAKNNYNNAKTWREFNCIIEKTRTAEVQYSENKSLKQVI